MSTTLPILSTPSVTNKDIKSVCVYCGASDGANEKYQQEAEELGKILGENNIRLVYGGGSVGLMGTVTRGALSSGGSAFAIVPEPLFRLGSKQICDYVVVPDMHTRKKRMFDESDAFVVLPGGFGTMEEMLEMITWSQLNVHSKPIILLNVNGYFDIFVEWIKFAVQEQFVRPKNSEIFVLCNSSQGIVNALKSYRAPESRYGLDWRS